MPNARRAASADRFTNFTEQTDPETGRYQRFLTLGSAVQRLTTSA